MDARAVVSTLVTGAKPKQKKKRAKQAIFVYHKMHYDRLEPILEREWAAESKAKGYGKDVEASESKYHVQEHQEHDDTFHQKENTGKYGSSNEIDYTDHDESDYEEDDENKQFSEHYRRVIRA